MHLEEKTMQERTSLIWFVRGMTNIFSILGNERKKRFNRGEIFESMRYLNYYFSKHLYYRFREEVPKKAAVFLDFDQIPSPSPPLPPIWTT